MAVPVLFGAAPAAVGHRHKQPAGSVAAPRRGIAGAAAGSAPEPRSRRSRLGLSGVADGPELAILPLFLTAATLLLIGAL